MSHLNSFLRAVNAFYPTLEFLVEPAVRREIARAFTSLLIFFLDSLVSWRLLLPELACAIRPNGECHLLRGRKNAGLMLVPEFQRESAFVFIC